MSEQGALPMSCRLFERSGCLARERKKPGSGRVLANLLHVSYFSAALHGRGSPRDGTPCRQGFSMRAARGALGWSAPLPKRCCTSRFKEKSLS